MPAFTKKRKGSYSLSTTPTPSATSPQLSIPTKAKTIIRRKMSEPVNIYSLEEKVEFKPRTNSDTDKSTAKLNGSEAPLSPLKSSENSSRIFKRKESRSSIELKYERQKMRRNSSVEACLAQAIDIHQHVTDHHMSRDKCPVCGYTVKTRDKVKLGRVSYHQICFKCNECEVVLNPKSYPIRPRTRTEFHENSLVKLRRGSDASWRGSLQDLRKKITSWQKPKKGSPEDQQLYCDAHRKPGTPGSGSSMSKEPESTMDLFDLIARTQNSRIDDQRCELPGAIQKCRSVSHLTIESPQADDHERVMEMLSQTKGPYPQVIKPQSGGYWVEGFTDKRQSDSDIMLRIQADTDGKSYELSRSDSLNYYKEYFQAQEHQNYLAQDDTLGPVVVSVKKEVHPGVGKLYRTVIRTKVSTVHELVRCDSENSEPSVYGLTKLCNDSITTNKFYPVTTLDASTMLKEFDDRFINRNFKFGVIYQEKGQTREEEFFGNKTTTPAFSEFLEQIGQRVPLQGFDGFRGGLDTIKGQTGAESIHTDFEGREIMFHVSTMLPYTDGDTQQLQRKRHIGNDIVAIVFQEESTPFIPNVIASQFLHAYIVVQPVAPNTENARYKVSVAARDDVTAFGPELQKSKLIKKECLRDFLLTKLLNAEYACHNAPQFKDKMERTRSYYLNELYEELLKLSLDTWCGLTTLAASSEKTHLAVFDTIKKLAMKRMTDSSYNTKKSNSSSVSSDGSKTPTQDQRISKLPYSHKKMHSDIALSHHSASWDRTASNNFNKSWNESTSLASFRSRGSFKSENDNNSTHSNTHSTHSDSPKDSNRIVFRVNGRSSSPTSLGSYGVEDDDGFLAHDHDSDTGVGSMSPTETPHGTWETRGGVNVSKSFNGSPSPCTRCTNCDPDLDYVALLKKEIVDLRKSKSQHSIEVSTLRAEVQEFTKRDKNNRADLREKTKQNLRLQHQIDELKSQGQTYRNELSRLQAVVAGMSGEEIV